MHIQLFLTDDLIQILQDEAQEIYGKPDVVKRAHHILIENLITSKHNRNNDIYSLMAGLLSMGAGNKETHITVADQGPTWLDDEIKRFSAEPKRPAVIPPAKSKRVKIDKKAVSKLKPPAKVYQGNINTQWRVWAFLVSETFNLTKWFSVDQKTVTVQLKQNASTVNSAFDSLTDKGWLTVKIKETPNLKYTWPYEFTREAKLWLKEPKNQQFLLNENLILDPSRAPKDIYDIYLVVDEKETTNVNPVNSDTGTPPGDIQ